jgi:beta-alanine--pyruvate transaminase
MVVRAEGLYLWNDRGDQIIDASSGLFCVSAGHGRKEIADAVGAQLRELDFCAPFLRAHPKQFELATRVAELTPGDLNRIFFVNSGSESVDTAMKVALAYHQARGQGGRNMFVSRERAYHGVGFGGVALSGLVNNRRKFGAGLPAVAHMRHTHLKENYFTKGEGAHGVELAEDLVRFVTLYGAENIAACFVEPIAGSSGCLCRPGYLSGCARSAIRTASARVRRSDLRFRPPVRRSPRGASVAGHPKGSPTVRSRWAPWR